MVGMSVRIDDQIESQSVIREDREVALDLVADWIDDGRLAGCFREREVSLTLAVIEFAKDHFDPCRIAKVIYLKTKDNVNIVAGLCLGFPTESYVAYTRKYSCDSVSARVCAVPSQRWLSRHYKA